MGILQSYVKLGNMDTVFKYYILIMSHNLLTEGHFN